jgi:hypothetical protein
VSIIDVLDQQVFWIGKDGLRHDLVTMDQEYRLNLLEYLRRNCESLARRRDRLLYEREELTSADAHVLYPSARDWVENSPFVRALKVTIALEDALDGEVVSDVPDVIDELAHALRQRRRHLDRAHGSN